MATLHLIAWTVLSCSPSQFVGCIRSVTTTTWFDEHLTEDNQEYMRRSMAEEYRSQTAAKLNPLKDEPWQRHGWTEGKYHILLCGLCESTSCWLRLLVSLHLILFLGSRRVGLVAVKLGMAPIWTKTGERHVVTLLQVPCYAFCFPLKQPQPCLKKGDVFMYVTHNEETIRCKTGKSCIVL